MTRTALSTIAALLLAGSALQLEAQQPPPQPPPTAPAQQQQQKAQQKRRGDRNKLTRVEIDEAAMTVGTARDAVRMLRPQWLQPPFGKAASSNMSTPGGGASAIVVYIDDMRQPDLESLTTVEISKVVEMRYLDQNRAIQIHGPGHEAGVIEIITVNKRK